MGMLFGGWMREEEENWKYENEKTGISFEDWQTKENYKRDNCNLTYIKKCGRFRGIELNQSDLICKKLNSEIYIINDFQADGRPICTLVTIEKHDFWNKPYPYETLLLIKSN